MLDANNPAFREQYPNGATVYDRTGRRIGNVFACNPETGEVITCDMGWIAKAWLRVLWAKDPFSHAYRWRLGRLRFPSRLPRYEVVSGEILRRHGFWPAPLTIRANTPPLPKHPMCRCILIPLKLATEADLAYVNDEPLPEVAWRSPITGEAIVVKGITGPNEHFNRSYTVTSVSHNTIPAID
jgi:hypothetical protein